MHHLTRRTFLKNGTLCLAASALLPAHAGAGETSKPKLRLGLVADLHHADKQPGGNRYYRESLTKFAEVARHFD